MAPAYFLILSLRCVGPKMIGKKMKCEARNSWKGALALLQPICHCLRFLSLNFQKCEAKTFCCIRWAKSVVDYYRFSVNGQWRLLQRWSAQQRLTCWERWYCYNHFYVSYRRSLTIKVRGKIFWHVRPATDVPVQYAYSGDVEYAIAVCVWPRMIRKRWRNEGAKSTWIGRHGRFSKNKSFHG